ncbi:permease prefix domain 1-containing protein [Cellulosilyticum sp. I15G10I2]|uniref:permease prefix domain 1-containing protein n=1 Tax=Cellulosilyticum sp. I15G10I2 TaxID=1892843 RepID=UPI00085C3160|nr:permease prefix domain 1-containing protein [Cellulosilyticum sp. I15G10I2]
METIKIYLENMFRHLPQTEELIRLKNELFLNMEEKYHELKSEGKLENEAVGIVISEFGNIDELLEEMNIKPAVKNEVYTTVGLEQAREFITLKQKTSYLIGMGVGLILLGVSLLILMVQLAEAKFIFQNLSENAQSTLPVILLFLCIAPAVGLFIYSGIKLEKFKYIDEGAFEMTSSTKAILSEELKQTFLKRNLGIIFGVSFCILSPIAILVASLFDAATYGVCVLLIMIAVAVFIFISSSSVSEAYKKLLMIEDFDPKRQKENKVIGAVAGIVWPLAVCIFLFCGFVFNLWHICWIVFPITGILFGGFCAFYSTIKSN